MWAPVQHQSLMEHTIYKSVRSQRMHGVEAGDLWQEVVDEQNDV